MSGEGSAQGPGGPKPNDPQVPSNPQPKKAAPYVPMGKRGLAWAPKAKTEEKLHTAELRGTGGLFSTPKKNVQEKKWMKGNLFAKLALGEDLEGDDSSAPGGGEEEGGGGGGESGGGGEDVAMEDVEAEPLQVEWEPKEGEAQGGEPAPGGKPEGGQPEGGGDKGDGGRGGHWGGGGGRGGGGRGGRGGRRIRLPRYRRDWGRLWSADHFFPGLIIGAMYHKTDLDYPSRLEHADDNQTLCKLHEWIYSKRYPMVIIEIHEEHFIALPIHTYTKTGLKYKSKEVKKEHIAVRNFGDANPTPSQAGNDYGIVLATKHAECPDGQDDWADFNWFCNVHFTWPITLEKKIHCVTIGTIAKEEDRIRLIEAYHSKGFVNAGWETV